MQLFHLTTAHSLSEILLYGLLPERSQSSLKAVFLTDCRLVAENYASMKDETCALLSIDAVEQFRLGPDNYELQDALHEMDPKELEDRGLYEGSGWQDCTWQQSLSICNQVACYSRIPPEYIAVLDLVTPTKNKG